LDRSASVAADTAPDDPRPYAVYLASFGPGLHKVGITGLARGGLRLREQAAVGSAFLGEGPLMAARRTEAVLGAALGLPDRVRDTAKRAARHRLPPPADRLRDLEKLHVEVTALRDRLPDALRLRPFSYDDHTGAYGLDADPPPAAPATEVTALAPGGAITGTAAVVAGHDVVVATPSGPVLLDARLTCGWPLRRAPAAPGEAGAEPGAEPVTKVEPFPTAPVPHAEPPPPSLF
jgi:hypothetical protein